MSMGQRGQMIPCLCAASLYIIDACDHAPTAFFTLNKPNIFRLSSKATSGKPPSSPLAPFATSPAGAHFSPYRSQKQVHHHSQSLTNASQRR